MVKSTRTSHFHTAWSPTTVRIHAGIAQGILGNTGTVDGIEQLVGLPARSIGYTVDEFNAVVAQINALPRGSANKKKLSRLIIGQSIKLDVDKDGRTVMPIKQRQKLGLTDGELTFSGLGDHFEIWKAETFSKEVADDLSDWLDGQEDGYDPLILLDG